MMTQCRHELHRVVMTTLCHHELHRVFFPVLRYSYCHLQCESHITCTSSDDSCDGRLQTRIMAWSVYINETCHYARYKLLIHENFDVMYLEKKKEMSD